MRIAIVHDWLCNLGGAERVLFEFHRMYPDAPIYTLFYNKNLTSQFIPMATIRASWLQQIPFIKKIYKYLLPLMPLAIESFDFSEFDVVLSSSVNFSKGLILKPHTHHVCYCYSPTRFLWDQSSEYTRHRQDYEWRKWLARISQHLLRIWDRQTANRVDEFVAISAHVQKRIKKYYGRDSKIIYPPVPITNDLHIKESDGGFYLIVSRLYHHKNIDITVEAFNKMGLQLIIIGDGPAKHKLKQIAQPHIRFLGHLSDDQIKKYYATCKAFIMPQEEDFGLTPVEAMSFGKPVLALGKGGAKEIIIEGKTGEFFDDPIPEALADGIRRLNDNYKNYQPEFIKSQTEKFSIEQFHNHIYNLVSNLTLPGM